jgi:uncharacterized protein with FMN-binding domain
MPSDAQLAARIEELKKSRSPRPDAGERPVRRRRHAARKSRMAALFLSVISTASLSATFLLMDASAQTQAAFAALPEPIALGEPTTVVVPPLDAPTQSSRGATPTTDAPAPAPVQVLAFNGQRADTPYGPVQVQVQVQAETGQLVDVAVVQFPDGDPTSRGINARALPRLRSEALAAQSAQIDTVSGATYTTRGYEASLQSAIDAARAADVQSGAAL